MTENKLSADSEPVEIDPHVMRYLEPNANLPTGLYAIADIVREAADEIISCIDPSHPQALIGLQKFLEAKDCFVRAGLDN